MPQKKFENKKKTLPSARLAALGKEYSEFFFIFRIKRNPPWISLPSVRISALSKVGPRQRPSLPCAKHSAKRDTRQTSSLPSVRHSAKNNPRQNTSADAGGPSVILCLVLAVSTRQTFCLCRVLQAWHSAKRFLCRVPIPTLGKVFLFFFYFCFQIFSMAFIQYLEAHVPIWNFSMTFWYIF